MNSVEARWPIVLHIPHSATRIPEEVRRTFLLNEGELSRELLRITDRYTDELYGGPFAPADVVSVVYPVSRLAADPERFPDDEREPMARHGQGVVYTLTQDGRPLRRPLTAAERQAVLDAYYHPHHARLLSAVRERLDRLGGCLIVDCHSFPDEPFPFERPADGPRPDICVGTDDYHTPADLERALVDFFRAEHGLTVDVNHPFAGALVPLPYYRREARVSSIMIEVNRRLYMDEKTGARRSDFDRWRRLLAEAIGRLGKTG